MPESEVCKLSRIERWENRDEVQRRKPHRKHATTFPAHSWGWTELELNCSSVCEIVEAAKLAKYKCFSFSCIRSHYLNTLGLGGVSTQHFIN